MTVPIPQSNFAVRALLSGWLIIAMTGCVSSPTAEELRVSPAPHLSADAPTGITDERSEFRQYFCDEYRGSSTELDGPADCDGWLHQLSDEPADVASMESARPNLQVLFVTGAFSECFDESARPFASAIAARTDGNDDFGTIVVGGRSGTKHNARQIADFLEAWPADPAKPLVLVGYSKGTNDILEFLVDYPGLASNVDAVVSVAGAVRGSPIADRYGRLYDLLFSRLPMGRCEKGDGDVVDDLRTDIRRNWLAEHVLPAHVRYYSLVAFTTRERVARALVRTWRSLLRDSRRNDGQLVPEDALLPNSSLLAYLNADHWAVALELEGEHPILAGRRDESPFPHGALLGAILRHVGKDFEGPR